MIFTFTLVALRTVFQAVGVPQVSRFRILPLQHIQTFGEEYRGIKTPGKTKVSYREFNLVNRQCTEH